ncbi:hypothetical protein ES332_A11G086500v1 [Gossypium tomentosum]|uniref:Uncharacterized protein n=1 Tax=Gossypium tomentosum TaxID=34277 RepID=A0A5D2N7U6_GOSTO|nr:hypothetical protein ES332_A11G086500v1 [Gossypium tomentosum]
MENKMFYGLKTRKAFYNPSFFTFFHLSISCPSTLISQSSP